MNGLLTVQPLQCPFDGDMDSTFLRRRAKIRVAERAGVLFAPFLGENEADNGEKLVLLEVGDEVGPEVLVRGVTSERRRSTPSSSANDRSSSCRRPSPAPASGWSSSTSSTPSSSATTSGLLQGCKTSSLTLLVLLAPKGVARRLETVPEELACRVEDLVHVFAGPKEVLERYGTFRC